MIKARALICDENRRFTIQDVATRPNILWVSFEDTNPFYGCYGDPVARTPHLDRLAARGCRWTHCFSTAGVCAPARSAVITGMYPISIGTHHMRTTHTHPALPELPTPYVAVPPHYVKCFTEYLRAVGYYCSNNEKTDYQFDPPSTAWDDLSGTAHWRNRPDPRQPFFAVFNPTTTHESGMWEEKCPHPTFDPDAITLPPYFPDTPEVRLAMARMHTNIERNDSYLGELLRQLEEDGLAENTIVFHWSDHGPLPRGKRWPYDSGIHVPLIVCGADGIAPGEVSGQLVSTIDLGPTVLSLAGVEIPRHMQGQAFLGPKAAPPRKYIFASRDRHDEAYDMVRAARDRRFKYMRHYHPELPYLQWIPFLNRHPIMREMWREHLADRLSGPQLLMFQATRPAEELYDVEADPHEIDNLASNPAYEQELVRLRSALDGWLDEVGDMGRISESEMIRRWYPDGKRPLTAAPVIIPLDAENSGIEPMTRGGVLVHPALLQLHCATQGASIAYALGDSDAPRWLLYTAPLRLPPGETCIRAKAIRIGYLESAETKAIFSVKQSKE